MGATFGISSVIGPLLGGVFTDKISWRWWYIFNRLLSSESLAYHIAASISTCLLVACLSQSSSSSSQRQSHHATMEHST